MFQQTIQCRLLDGTFPEESCCNKVLTCSKLFMVVFYQYLRGCDLLFPDSYKKPVLLNIIDAAANGWNAVCESGLAPGSGSTVCTTGAAPQTVPVCVGTGSSPSNKGDIYYRGGSREERLFNTDDMGEGF